MNRPRSGRLVQWFRGVILFAGALLCGEPALLAETKTVELPASYVDFALHPLTGDIAAIDAEAHTVSLFRTDFFAGKPDAVVGPERVGESPTSIVYKRYGDQDFFAVLCSKDSHLYLFKAASLELVKKIPVQNSGVLVRCSSNNSADPFLYYSYSDTQPGSSREHSVGVVDLRELVDRGKAFENVFDFAVASNGAAIYYRRDDIRANLSCLLLANDLDAEMPRFARGDDCIIEPVGVVPDPLREYVAAGAALHNFTLSQKVADLPIQVACFFQGRPVIVGFPKQGSFAAKKEIELQAASYNTLRSIGSPVAVPATIGESTKNSRKRVFADDARQQVVYASQKYLLFAPLSDFKLPDEPFLRLSVQTPALFEVGREYLLPYEPADRRVSVAVESMPEGMTESPKGLQWTPTEDHVGEQQVAFSLRHDALERRHVMKLEVEFPSVKLPFVAASLGVDGGHAAAVVWDLRPSNYPSSVTLEKKADKSQVAVVDLKAGKVLIHKQLNFWIGAAAIDAQNLYLVAHDTQAVQVIDRKSLKRVKTLYGETPIHTLENVRDRWLTVYEQQRTVSYALPDLKRLAGPDQKPGFVAAVQGGVYRSGLLLNATGSARRLLLNPRPCLHLSGGLTSSAQSVRFGPFGDINPLVHPNPVYNAESARQHDSGRRWPGLLLEDSPARIAAVARREDPRSGDPRQRQGEVLALDLTSSEGGPAKRRIILARRTLTSGAVFDPYHQQPPYRVRGNTALVLYKDRLYSWTAGKLDPDEFPPPVRIDNVQSTFVLDATGPTTLTHTVQGGKPPYEFSLSNSWPSVTVDETTGAVTVDSAAIQQEAETALVDRFKPSQLDAGRPAQPSVRHPVEQLKEFADLCRPQATAFLARAPQGLVAALPVEIQVADSESQSDWLRYFVLVEVPFAKVEARLKKLAPDPASSTAEDSTAGEAGPPTDQNDLRQEVTALRERVESVEAQLDLLTRELGRLRQPEK